MSFLILSSSKNYWINGPDEKIFKHTQWEIIHPQIYISKQLNLERRKGKQADQSINSWKPAPMGQFHNSKYMEKSKLCHKRFHS